MAHLSRPLSLDECTLIIDYLSMLHWLDRGSALKAMCLAHRSFVPFCQKYLFSFLSYSPKKVDTFLDIVKVSPHLTAYIRIFFFEFDSKTSSANFPGNANTRQFLDKLDNLRVLVIKGPESSRAGYDWKAFDSQVSDALLRLIRSPKLEILELHRFQNFPIQGLLQLKNATRLKNLSIATLVIDPDTAPAASSTTNADASDAGPIARQLSTLKSYAGSESAVEVLMGRFRSRPHHPPIFDFAELRHFDTEWPEAREAKTSQLIIGSAHYLEDLYCILPKESTASYKGLAESILKGSFRTLRELVLYTEMPGEENADDPFHGSIEELIKLAGEMKSLEYIDMKFECYTTDIDEVPYDLSDTVRTKCELLDGIFADHEAFPSLGLLSIDLTIVVLDDPELNTLAMEEQFETAVRGIKQQSFPNLKISPTINFKFDLDMRWHCIV
ncbi:hypothetical protein BJ912DRAFT_34156 [Pholiota molesta]|nr:hypothetical protein BJ912DRAFT_34156 [Pholiota molesta]